MITGLSINSTIQHVGLANSLDVAAAGMSALPAWFSWDRLLPYFAAVLPLALGVGLVIKKAPPKENWLEKFVLLGPVFIGMPMAVFGTEHYLDPPGVGQVVPAWIPAHIFWVYLVGTCLILGGLSLCLQRHAWLSAGLFGVMLLSLEVLMHIPRVFANPHKAVVWALAARDFCFSWGALSYAATNCKAWKIRGTQSLITLSRVGAGLVMVFYAVLYILHPELLPGVPLRQLTPSFLPGHSLWGYLNGILYIGSGFCVLLNFRARTAAAILGFFNLCAVVFFCLPLMFQHLSQIGLGLNVPVDTLLMSGALLGLAGGLKNVGFRLARSEKVADREQVAAT